ncbi:hypothetical protein [Brevundimonas sp. NIBR11]|uniref:hypothetical protein n=1 Tax=Brevundimonas sp. NIBR11 TaxID=3015999 RepID=UPI0022F0E082|nr:hypothetical protein [Brevundimonas sp. NIBR11]WGM31076.1 hypothetical protein KKHFBJBL_01313 [Brevundimonas sp. NIBR11]
MKRIEPNFLLAVSTVIALSLLIVTGAVFGEPGGAVKYPIIAVICVVAFVVGNGMMAGRTGRITPPLINLDTPATAAWAGAFPMIVMAFAAIPLLWTGHDYGLLVILASVIAGVTVESALKARRA